MDGTIIGDCTICRKNLGYGCPPLYAARDKFNVNAIKLDRCLTSMLSTRTGNPNKPGLRGRVPKKKQKKNKVMLEESPNADKFYDNLSVPKARTMLQSLGLVEKDSEMTQAALRTLWTKFRKDPLATCSYVIEERKKTAEINRDVNKRLIESGQAQKRQKQNI